MKTNAFNKRGISPVIGVILMVALTVILAAVIGVYSIGFSDTAQPYVNAGLIVDESDEGVEVRWISKGNADTVYILVNGSRVSGSELRSVGSSVTVTADDGDSVSIMGVNSERDAEQELKFLNTKRDTTDGSGVPQVVTGPVTLSASVPHTSEPDCSSDVSYVDNDGDGRLDVSNDYELQCMELDGSYELVTNIDASGTSSWNGGSGFAPVGPSFPETFEGQFYGNGYKISGLTIDRPAESEVGLFGYAYRDATMSNFTLEGVNITGSSRVGGIVGRDNNASISDVSVSGSIDGAWFVGGIVGEAQGTSMTRVVSSADISSSGRFAGGAIGRLSSNGSISNSYSTGDVQGVDRVAGLAGSTRDGGAILSSYATGNVSGTGSYVQGLVGTNYGGLVDKSYWNKETTGQTTSAGLPDSYGLTTSEMQGSDAESNMSGFDFVNIWETVESDYPELS